MQEVMKKRAVELLTGGQVARVLAWRKGEFMYDPTPDVFTDAADLWENMVYNEFCGANLSKYLIKAAQKEGKTLVFLKPCDTYSFNQLMSEHKMDREKVYIVGIECYGKVDIEKVRLKGITGIKSVKTEGGELVFDTVYGEEKVPAYEVYAERCISCKSKKHVAYDELIGEDGEVEQSERFDMVEKLENMTADERFAFWQGELSRCIRCNACRNVCPACTCEKCIFDNPDSGFENKAPSDSFEENMFHIIRAFHVAGRCTDCGECSRVCPENIPLHLLNRKFIKDINELYGEYQAGAEINERGPLVSYTQGDVEPSVVYERGAE